MRQYPCGAAVMAMTAAVMIMLRMSVQGQTAAPSPVPGQTNDQNSEVNATNTQANGGQLEQVTVTGYLIPRVGEGPQPVETLKTTISSPDHRLRMDRLASTLSTRPHFSDTSTSKSRRNSNSRGSG